MCWGEPPSTHGGILFSYSLEDPCSSIGVVYSSLSRSLQDPIEGFCIVSCASLVSLKKIFLHMARCVAHPTHQLLSNPTPMHSFFYYIHAHVFHMHHPLGPKHFLPTFCIFHWRHFACYGILKGLWFIIPISWLCWPQIIFKKLLHNV